MEDNKKELAYWTINHFQKKLQIVEQRWNIFEKQPFFDYKVNIKIKNKNFVGRGTNISQQDAFESAIGEALERCAINFNEIKSSNGCAFHTNLKSAITNANNEILERHYAMLFTLGYWDQEKVDDSDYPQEIKKILII